MIPEPFRNYLLFFLTLEWDWDGMVVTVVRIKWEWNGLDALVIVLVFSSPGTKNSLFLLESINGGQGTIITVIILRAFQSLGKRQRN